MLRKILLSVSLIFCLQYSLHVFAAYPILLPAPSHSPSLTGKAGESLVKAGGESSVWVSHLSVEGRRDNPLGLDVEAPSFGWQLTASDDVCNVKQTGYHILVASSKELLDEDKGDMWDETVASDQSQWIKYRGKALKANTQYFWKVKVEYSYSPLSLGEGRGEASSFSTGLFRESAWKGYWIGMDHANEWDVETEHSRLSARYFRTTFDAKKSIKRATLHICGLGLYEAYIDGEKVGDYVLTPAPTDYTKSVIYNTYDVTQLLGKVASSSHALAVCVSNGRFYTMQQNKKKHKIANFGYPCLRANLIIEYSDGTSETIATNEKSWKINADGAIRSANEYDGEIYDARKEFGGSKLAWTKADFDDSGWALAERSAIPRGTPVGNLTPPMKVIDTLQPTIVSQNDTSVIIDFKQNFAGWVRINIGKMNLSEGDTLRIRYAEKLNEDGTLYTANLRHAQSTDYYIAKGKEEGWWSPRFTTHGGRYVAIDHLPSTTDNSHRPQIQTKSPSPRERDGERLDWVSASVISDEMAQNGTFSCDNDIINALVKNAYWGILGNYKGMPIDCPQRDERMPWLGDRTMGCWGESFLLDNEALYYKWMKDICEAQKADGVIPDVAPAYWNYYSDDVTWPAVLVTATDMLWQQYGDSRAIEQFYPNMYRWMAHLWNDKRDRKTGLVKADKYADWCVTPEAPELIHSQDPSRITDGTLIGSCYMYHLAGIMKRFCSILLGKAESEDALSLSRKGISRDVLVADTLFFSDMRESLREAINKEYLVVKEGSSPVKLYGPESMPEHILYPDSIYYSNNALTANLLPLAFGIVPEKYEKAVTSQVLAKLLLNPANGHLCCGVIGVQWLLTELSKRGRTDVAYLLASHDDFPSWGYMVKNGATTIWELWNGDTANPAMNSGNHVMLLGDLVPWMFRELGGINAASPGYKTIRLAPRFELEELSHAEASHNTPYGTVSSSWKKDLQHLTWDIEIPCNTTAEVVFPDKTLTLGSGKYHFEENIPTADPRIISNIFAYEKAPFPSCHAATIAELNNGDLLMAYFGGSYEGCKDVCIYTQRLKLKKRDLKNGNIYEDKWTEPKLVADGILNDTLRKACYNPVLFQIPNGDLLLHYKIGKDVRDWTGYQMRSKDNGKTWKSEPLTQRFRGNEPADADERDGLLGAIKNQPIMLPAGFRCKNGTVLSRNRIVAPTSKEAENGSKTKPGQWRCFMEISEDDGKTWMLTQQVPQDDAIFRTIQPALLVHNDGRLQLLCRTASPKKPELKDNALVATSWSDDGGMTWSEMEFVHDLPNNNSGIDAVTLSSSTGIDSVTTTSPRGSWGGAIIYNPFGCVDWLPKTDANRNKPLRNPLWIAKTRDGIHWTPSLQLESSPISQYSYPSMIVGSDGTIHCVYTWRRQRIKYQRVAF